MRQWIKKILVVMILLFSIASISHAAINISEASKYEITVTEVPHDTIKIELIALDQLDENGQELVLESYLPNKIKDNTIKITIKENKYKDKEGFELVDCQYGIRFDTKSEEKTIKIERLYDRIDSIENMFINKTIVSRTYDYKTSNVVTESVHHTPKIGGFIFVIIIVGVFIFGFKSIIELLSK